MRPRQSSKPQKTQVRTLPKFHFRSFEQQAMDAPPEVNRAAPGFGRKAVIYATCFVNYNDPGIGHAARAVLAHNGVETEIVYPACCGMPKLEHGDLAAVAESARTVSATLAPWLDRGYDVIALTPSCALMLKFEWPLILPDDAAVKRLAGASFDIPEYVVNIAKKEGLAPGLGALDGGVTVHLACHARAQNMGPKAVEMLKLIPQADLGVIERCSGHGGSWGVLKEFHGVALKVGKPAARTALTQGKRYVTSECPLAARHLLEGMRELKPDAAVPARPYHPIELLAQAYGLYP